jgi:hypothetical protein
MGIGYGYDREDNEKVVENYGKPLFDFGNENLSLSDLDNGINIYQYIQKCSQTDNVHLPQISKDSIGNFIDNNAELLKTVKSIRKNIQDNFSQDLYTDLFPCFKSTLVFPSARDMKRHIVEQCADNVFNAIKQEFKENPTDIKISGISMKFDTYTHPDYSDYHKTGNKEDIKYFTSQTFWVYPDIIFPDDRVKEIINDTLANLQTKINEYCNKKELDETEEEIER